MWLLDISMSAFGHLSLLLIKSWNVNFVVYDTMGYIQTVNNTADASMLDQIREVQNTNSYQQRNGAVSLCNKWNKTDSSKMSLYLQLFKYIYRHMYYD